MKIDETKLEEIRKHLLEATMLLNSISAEQQTGGEEKVENWMKDRVELWCRIYNEGGSVTQDRLHEIWEKEMEKDNRGLGGFFNGKGASLVWTPDDKAALTKSASDFIEAWLGKSIGEYAKRFKK